MGLPGRGLTSREAAVNLIYLVLLPLRLPLRFVQLWQAVPVFSLAPNSPPELLL